MHSSRRVAWSSVRARSPKASRLTTSAVRLLSLTQAHALGLRTAAIEHLLDGQGGSSSSVESFQDQRASKGGKGGRGSNRGGKPQRSASPAQLLLAAPNRTSPTTAGGATGSGEPSPRASERPLSSAPPKPTQRQKASAPAVLTSTAAPTATAAPVATRSWAAIAAPIAKRRVEHQVEPSDALDTAPLADESSAMALDTALGVDAPSPSTATTPASSASASDGSHASAGVAKAPPGAVTTTAPVTAPETAPGVAPGTALGTASELSAMRAQLLELQATRSAEQVRASDCP